MNLLTTLSKCLAVTVEADLININTINKEMFDFDEDRYYETEAIIMFKSWRKNAGELKDIPIYALCLTGNGVSVETQKIFKELNVTYIEDYDPETKTFFSGFWNIPLGGVWFENNLKEDIIIKLDLDMYLIKSLPNDLFNLPSNGCSVGIFDKYHTDDIEWERILPDGALYQTNTCLMISYRTSNVYTEWYNNLKQMSKQINDTKFINYMKSLNLEPDDIEEFSFDEMLFNNKFSNEVNVVERFQFGEHYPSLDTFSDDELDNVYFRHEHYKPSDDYDKIYNILEYRRRINVKNKGTQNESAKELFKHV